MHKLLYSSWQLAGAHGLGIPISARNGEAGTRRATGGPYLGPSCIGMKHSGFTLEEEEQTPQSQAGARRVCKLSAASWHLCHSVPNSLAAPAALSLKNYVTSFPCPPLLFNLTILLWEPMLLEKATAKLISEERSQPCC